MAITYTWTFKRLETCSEGGLERVVKTVHWRLAASESGETADVFDGTALSAADPGAFTGFDDLTEEQVKGWVLDALGETEAEVQARAAAALAAKVSPPMERLAPPWE